MKASKVSARLNLKAVEPIQQQWAIEAFEAGDMDGFTMSAYSRGGTLAIVVDNYLLLKQRELFEAALVHGFIGCKINHAHWSAAFINSLFLECDREKLLAVGHELPGPGPFQLYRGVAGEGRKRKIRGLSWTDSLDVACWFAMRCFGSPAIYVATVKAADIYCYAGQRGEREFITYPKAPKLMALTVQEIANVAKAHAKTIESRNHQIQKG